MLKKRLTDQTVALLIKEYLNLAGKDSKKYSRHSLRSGFAASAAESGVEERSIMAMTGHKSTETDNIEKALKPSISALYFIIIS